uniref:Ribosomal protein L22 n=1 Tax=Broussonetia papyrifera TaxID=172644 RepID=A0A8F8X6Z6_BROPA|nr:ribosomal protein L22 [Broussonetia papyrifera]
MIKKRRTKRYIEVYTIGQYLSMSAQNKKREE